VIDDEPVFSLGAEQDQLGVALDPDAVVLALGAIAHGAVLRARGLKASAYVFGHGAEHLLPGGRRLFDSYHCSRYNTQTKRLTTEMFREVVGRATARAREGE